MLLCAVVCHTISKKLSHIKLICVLARFYTINTTMPSEGETDPKGYIDEQFIKVKCSEFFQEFSRNFKVDLQKTFQNMLEMERLKDYPSLDDLHQQNNFDKCGTNLYNSLERQIEYLKDEAKSKNKIIEMLISDKKSENITHVSHNNDLQKSQNFQHPKNTIKQKQLTDSYCNCLTKNRYEALSVENDINDNDRIDEALEDNKKESTHRNDDNVTKRNRHKKKAINNGNKNNKERTVVAILGDSIIKDVHGWDLSSEKKKVVVKSFSGATTNCMRSHIIPTKEQNPDVIILHCGTNDLRKTDSLDSIATNILELATSVSTDTNRVIVSGLTQRNDQYWEKVDPLNNLLKSGASSRNIGFIEHPNINYRYHLNRSNLHLNRKGSLMVTQNFDEFIKK